MLESMNAMNNASVMMNLIADRQKALGDNLANMDTPGYVRKDVDFSQQLNSAGGDLENKMNSKFGNSPIAEQSTGEPVTAANEIIELQKNAVLYSMATRQMSSIITEMKTAINVGK